MIKQTPNSVIPGRVNVSAKSDGTALPVLVPVRSTTTERVAKIVAIAKTMLSVTQWMVHVFVPLDSGARTAARSVLRIRLVRTALRSVPAKIAPPAHLRMDVAIVLQVFRKNYWDWFIHLLIMNVKWERAILAKNMKIFLILSDIFISKKMSLAIYVSKNSFSRYLRN